MSESFDPYLKWLGIPPREQPPNHYRLLGIDPFCADPDVIDNAAERQMIYVRRFATGPHAAESQKLLNELAQARVCLLDEQARSVYDRHLRGQANGDHAEPKQQQHPQPAASPQPKKESSFALPPLPALEDLDTDIPTPRIRSTPALEVEPQQSPADQRRKWRPNVAMLVLGCVAVAIAVGVYIAFNSSY